MKAGNRLKDTAFQKGLECLSQTLLAGYTKTVQHWDLRNVPATFHHEPCHRCRSNLPGSTLYDRLVMHLSSAGQAATHLFPPNRYWHGDILLCQLGGFGVVCVCDWGPRRRLLKSGVESPNDINRPSLLDSWNARNEHDSRTYRRHRPLPHSETEA